MGRIYGPTSGGGDGATGAKLDASPVHRGGGGYRRRTALHNSKGKTKKEVVGDHALSHIRTVTVVGQGPTAIRGYFWDMTPISEDHLLTRQRTTRCVPSHQCVKPPVRTLHRSLEESSEATAFLPAPAEWNLRILGHGHRPRFRVTGGVGG